MTTYTREDIQDWKRGYEGIPETIKNNLHLIKTYEADSQQHNRNIISIVQRLKVINSDSIFTGTNKLEKIRIACDEAKRLYLDYENKYKLTREKQQLDLLRAQAREHKGKQLKHGEEHKKLLKSDVPHDEWSEQNENLGQKVLKEAQEISALEKQIIESERLIEGYQAKIKDGEKDEAESLENMHDHLMLLESRFNDLQKQIENESKSINQLQADNLLYEGIINQPSLKNNLQVLSPQRRAIGGKLQAELNGLYDSGRAHLEKIRMLEDSNFWLERQSALLADKRYLYDVVYDSYGLCQRLTADIESLITEFESNLPHAQSIFIRKILHDLNKYVQIFRDDITRENAETFYYKYLGMVESCRRAASLNAEQDAEKIELLRLFGLHIFNNHLLDSNEIFNEFTAAKNADNKYQADADAVALQAEKDKFQLALQACDLVCTQGLNANPVQELKKVYETGRMLNQEIAYERATCLNQGREHEFDFKYFTRLLHDACDVIRSPADNNVRTKFERTLGFNTSGASNSTLRWRALAFMLSGAALAVAGLVVGVTMFGLSSPLMIAMYAASGVMFTVGLACVFASRQKGIDKKAHQLARNCMFAPVVPPANPAISSVAVAPSIGV